MNNFFKHTIKLLLFCSLFLVFVWVNNFAHESVHEQIYRHHGCTEYKINFEYGFPFSARCLKRIKVDDEIRQQEKFLHSLNEIFGYTLYFPLLFMQLYYFYGIVKRI